MAPFRWHGMADDALRFLSAGAINTILSLLIYQMALFILSPTFSYVIAWISGLAFVFAVYPDHVFPGSRRGIKGRLLLAASYASVFVAGLLFLRIIVTVTAAPRLAIFATLAVTTLSNFLLSRHVLRGGTK